MINRFESKYGFGDFVWHITITGEAIKSAVSDVTFKGFFAEPFYALDDGSVYSEAELFATKGELCRRLSKDSKLRNVVSWTTG